MVEPIEEARASATLPISAIQGQSPLTQRFCHMADLMPENPAKSIEAAFTSATDNTLSSPPPTPERQGEQEQSR